MTPEEQQAACDAWRDDLDSGEVYELREQREEEDRAWSEHRRSGGAS